ncbi:hypothetical protein HGB07_01040, partial [Candidatus Roizmanbacteria bacterium]|nr:hypothetical protein [Candidatus Roizmanbacteria bacterium]
IIYKNKRSPEAKQGLDHVVVLTNQIINWFHRNEKTKHVLANITKLNDYFLMFEPLTQANFIVRMKQEQSNIRRIVNRIHTIRETSFNASGYAVAEVITFLLCVGLVFVKIDPYYESLFFVTFVSFILIYMILLIKDLDNPFGYYEQGSVSEDVSLKPMHDVIDRINEKL